jgi:hypothetical protein
MFNKIDELGTPKLKSYVKSISEFSELEISFNKNRKNTEDFVKKRKYLQSILCLCKFKGQT